MKKRTLTESTFEFVDKTTGETTSFEPVSGKYILSYDEPSLEGLTAAEETAAIADPRDDRARGYRVVELETSSNEILGAEDVSAGLSNDQGPAAVNSLPAMRDQEGIERYIVPDEFALQFVDGVPDDEASALLERYRLDVKTRFQTPGFYLVSVPEGQGLFAVMNAVAREAAIAFVEPSEFSIDDQLGAQEALSETELSTLWGFENKGQDIKGVKGTPGMDVRARDAWALTRGTPEVILVVLDTGCQIDHPDLAANLLHRPDDESWNFVRPHLDDPTDPHGHGTHVCGTCAAVENDEGVIGLAPKCKLMPLQVELVGSSADYQRRADAINLVARRAKSGAKTERYVLNLSWRTSGNVISIRRAIEAALDAGVVVVAAAGNANSNMDSHNHYPAKYQGVLAVAAIDQKGVRASFSNYGDRIDLSAPGVSIRSTVPGGTYDYSNGTSMAAPHVAAAAALILSLRPTAGIEQVRAKLLSTARPIDALNPGLEGKLGSGILDAGAAVATLATS